MSVFMFGLFHPRSLFSVVGTGKPGVLLCIAPSCLCGCRQKYTREPVITAHGHVHVFDLRSGGACEQHKLMVMIVMMLLKPVNTAAADSVGTP